MDTATVALTEHTEEFACDGNGPKNVPDVIQVVMAVIAIQTDSMDRSAKHTDGSCASAVPSVVPAAKLKPMAAGHVRPPRAYGDSATSRFRMSRNAWR